MSDPLDIGKPSQKRWEEFRAQYAAALLPYWVIGYLKVEVDDGVAELGGRFQSSLRDYPELLQRDAKDRGEKWDGFVPFHERDETQIIWFHVDDLGALYDSLFPHDIENASISSAIAGATVVGIHSALDTYAKALRIDVKKGLVNGIRGYLVAKDRALSADLGEALDDCDATRHIIVHNRGCVDEAYIRRVRNSPLQLGEVRILNNDVVDRFSRAVSQVAAKLRVCDDADSGAIE